ncbi:putative serine/threonine-protein kinase isoform X4 [Gossypium australe]|uniref:non-specific serine/threonine protein kinase n=1 Tax=Gossypium australe TaxID=47621 RepID=A0A5B6UQ17_9ROSI|nr:putative serine/threonine-protein kinase isoform X4 [Gossypium australe]
MQSFNCGTIQGIGYPFWSPTLRPSYCGHHWFELICQQNQSPVITINTQRFHVLNITRPPLMAIAPVDTWEDPCPRQFHNISLNHNLFDFAATIRNLTIFYGCPLEDDIPSQHRFNCGTTTSNGNTYAYYLDESLSRIHRSELTDCDTSIVVPVNQSQFAELWNGTDNIVGAWNKGFEVMYQKDMISCLACRNSGGVCGSDSSSLDFLCFCPDYPYSKSCVVSDNTWSTFITLINKHIYRIPIHLSSKTSRMHYQLCLSTLAISIFTFFLTIFFLIPLSYSQDDENFAQCFDAFSCGDVHNLMFPFSKDDRPELCHQDGFVLSKCEDPQPIIHIGGNEYRLMYLNHSTFTMSIVRNDLWEQSCLPNPINITINDSFLNYSPTNRHLTLFYNCFNVPQRPIIFPCSPELLSFYADDLSERDTYRDLSNSCGTNIQVQVSQSSFNELQAERNEYMLEEWRFGFNVVYDFPAIFCERCDNLVEKCSNLMNSSRYPVCKSVSVPTQSL